MSAPGGGTASTTDDAARGTHTIVVVASDDGSDGPRGVNTVTLEVQVGGSPATVQSDAPERLDPSGELTVNITVVDDEGVRVGSVAIEVDQTAGDGKIITEIAAEDQRWSREVHVPRSVHAGRGRVPRPHPRCRTGQGDLAASGHRPDRRWKT